MLLPSALPCDWRQQPQPSSRSRSRFPASRLFSTPPPSDDEQHLPSGNGLLGTCRALQSLLNGSPAPSPRRARSTKPERPRLQSPLPIFATSTSTPTSARSRKSGAGVVANPSTPKPTPSRGANKRRRCDDDDDDYEEEDSDFEMRSDRFSTPKRRRQAPYHLPMGLSQSDFYSLHSPPITQSPPSPAQRRQQELAHVQFQFQSQSQPQTQTPIAQTQSQSQSYNPDTVLPSIEESDESEPLSWTPSDDERLVELVLEKFKLSRADWEDCARSLGKDQVSVGRRWHALVGEGNVGLRRGRRNVRAKIDENWR